MKTAPPMNTIALISFNLVWKNSKVFLGGTIFIWQYEKKSKNSIFSKILPSNISTIIFSEPLGFGGSFFLQITFYLNLFGRGVYCFYADSCLWARPIQIFAPYLGIWFKRRKMPHLQSESSSFSYLHHGQINLNEN